jgi:hypothetical protein
VLGHDHVTGDYEAVALSRLLENLQKQNRVEMRSPARAGGDNNDR